MENNIFDKKNDDNTVSDHEMALIEAILFLETVPVEAGAISKIIGIDSKQVEIALNNILNEYSLPSHGIELVKTVGGFIFAPKKDYWNELKDRYGKKGESRMSRAALETLSIIAYSQPITRTEIEAIRGVSADNMIRLLLERGLIRETGKKDVPGKPAQYGTTKDFLKFFRLDSIADLPKLDELEQERFELENQ